MAPSRYRPMGSRTRSNLSASRASTKHTRNVPRASINQERESSHDEHDEIEFESDLNELFIQSIEELLPKQEQNVDKSATPEPSLQISPITPGAYIKIERVSDSLEDMYNVSPRGYVHKAADVGRRRTSRSTAQLTTPGSSPERKGEPRNAAADATTAKSEVNHERDERLTIFETRYMPPASSSEERVFPNRPASMALPKTSYRPLSRANKSPSNNQDKRENSAATERHSTTTILPATPILVRGMGHESATVSSPAFSTKIPEPQKTCEKSIAHDFPRGNLPIEYPPILPPLKVRPLISKTTTIAHPSRDASAVALTSQKLLPVESNITSNETCCKLVCLQCNPKDVVEEHVIELPEKRPHILRMKSLSACPSSVSSFGPDDDIPPSDKMRREAGRAVTQSTKAFASDRMTEVSPSLRYSDLLARLGIYHSAPTGKEEINDIYEDFDETGLAKNNPCRLIFGKAGNKVADHARINGYSTHIRSQDVQEGNRRENKKLQQIPSRSLRSFSVASNLSKKPENIAQTIDSWDEDDLETEPFHGSIGGNTQGEDEYSGSEYEERTSQKAAVQVPPKPMNRAEAMKRVRETVENWQPIFSDDEDMADGDDIIEINRDVFEFSENRRKKRHKSKAGEPDRVRVPASPVPKDEPVDELEEISSAAQDFETAEIGTKDDAGIAEQEKSPCDYYMNTYWEHGRGSDGRRARDGFISYVDFKEYCRKNRQPTDDRCMLTYKKDLKHHLRCEYHASLRQDLHRVAWNFEHNPGFSFKSCSKDEETRRIQNEAIGNAPSPNSSSRGTDRTAAVAHGQIEEIIAEVIKVVGTSHTADVAQLMKSKRKVENELKGMKRYIARMQKR